MKKRFLIIFIILIFPFLAVKAQNLDTSIGFLDSLVCTEDGSCSLVDMEQGFRLLISRLVALIGAAALLFLVYGGLKWLTSQGREEKITSGKNIIIGSIVAITIALLSGIFIRFYTEELFRVKEYTPGPPLTQEDQE